MTGFYWSRSRILGREARVRGEFWKVVFTYRVFESLRPSHSRVSRMLSTVSLSCTTGRIYTLYIYILYIFIVYIYIYMNVTRAPSVITLYIAFLQTRI